MPIHSKDSPSIRPAFPSPRERSKNQAQGLSLYIHVPFCKTRCHYCTFHSQAFNQVTLSWYLKTLEKEIHLWGKRLKRPKLKTLYLGGGTPSLLGPYQLDDIVQSIHKNFSMHPNMEITLEANPDSATDVSYFRALRSIGFNRLSFGIQSLDDVELMRLGRPHSAAQAIESFAAARTAGFNNISVDFIWGLPDQRLKTWLKTLEQAVKMKPEHISAYNLTLEPHTPLGKQHEAGELALPDEQEAGRMFIYGAEYLESHGFMHYEVSNFARMGFMSAHNTSYWEGQDYLGLGPSAVSTLGKRRFTNPRYMDEYDAAVRGEFVGQEHEILTEKNLLQEMVMLSLRTTKGLDLKEFRERAGYDLVKRQNTLVSALHRQNLVRINQGRLKLTKNGMLVSNPIVQRLIFDD